VEMNVLNVILLTLEFLKEEVSLGVTSKYPRYPFALAQHLHFRYPAKRCYNDFLIMILVSIISSKPNPETTHFQQRQII